jgi:hypothetical protein
MLETRLETYLIRFFEARRTCLKRQKILYANKLNVFHRFRRRRLQFSDGLVQVCPFADHFTLSKSRVIAPNKLFAKTVYAIYANVVKLVSDSQKKNGKAEKGGSSKSGNSHFYVLSGLAFCVLHARQSSRHVYVFL